MGDLISRPPTFFGDLDVGPVILVGTSLLPLPLCIAVFPKVGAITPQGALLQNRGQQRKNG